MKYQKKWKGDEIQKPQRRHNYNNKAKLSTARSTS